MVIVKIQVSYIKKQKKHISDCVCSFKHETELSKHIWSLKDQNIKYNITWGKVKQTIAYTNVSKKCCQQLIDFKIFKGANWS